MKWYTHAAIGANAVWLTTLTQDVTSGTLLLAVLGAFASLLPDIDAGWGKTSGAKIHHIGYGVFRPFRGMFRHRGFFHSLLCVAVLFCVTLPFAAILDPYVPIVFVAGYASHLVIDAWNGGMQYLYPLKKDFSFVPKFLRFRVGSSGDDLFFILGIMGIVAFIFLHWSAFLIQNITV